VSEVPGDEGHRGYGPFHGGDAQPAAPEPVAAEGATDGVTAYQSPAQTRPAADSWSLFPDGGPGSPSWQPRIVPTPRPSRRRVVVAALLGLLAGLLVFGPTGYLTGYATAPAPVRVKPTPSPSTRLPEFERTQLALNKPKFPSTLTPIATSWLPWVAGCQRSGDKDAPRAGEGEDTRVTCHYSNTSIFFIQYRSTDDRDKAYTRYLGQNIDAKQLAPGVAEPATKKTTSGAVNGHYVEFAFRTSTDANAKTICGVWWADATAPIAAYVLAFWTDGLGENWEPIRDVWRRYS
jgi:hypothetical protein